MTGTHSRIGLVALAAALLTAIPARSAAQGRAADHSLVIAEAIVERRRPRPAGFPCRVAAF